MMREVRWERMFRDELEAAFADTPLLWLPYGLCEPHGPQNAVGLDALKVHAIACRAAHQRGGIVAPPYYWHVHEQEGYAGWAEQVIGDVSRHWLTAIPPWLHARNLCYHIRTADTMGFHAAILLSGHAGPHFNDMKLLIELLQPHVRTRLVWMADFEANYPGFDSDDQSIGDHAGRVETSLMWALEPDCVDMSRLPEPDDPGPHYAMGENAPSSNRKVGERMVNDEIQSLIKTADTLLKDYAAQDKLPPGLLTFKDVEAVWQDVVEPRLHEFDSMQSTTAVAENSVWRANQPACWPAGYQRPQ